MVSMHRIGKKITNDTNSHKAGRQTESGNVQIGDKGGNDREIHDTDRALKQAQTKRGKWLI